MNKEEIFNTGLAFALEFGPNWLQPIQSRLSEKYPMLTTDDLNNYNKVCKLAMKKGHGLVMKKLAENSNIKDNELHDAVKEYLHNDYPWINDSNMRSIISQGFYYAWKDGFRPS